MATRETIRKPEIYVNARKVAFSESGELTITDNGEQHIGSEGVMGDSDGAITSELTLAEVIPTSGIDSGLLDALLDQQDVTVQWQQGGIILAFDGRCSSGKLNGESRTGTSKGNWTIRGGKPERT
jgi:hypothetical protein